LTVPTTRDEDWRFWPAPLTGRLSAGARARPRGIGRSRFGLAEASTLVFVDGATRRRFRGAPTVVVANLATLPRRPGRSPATSAAIEFRDNVFARSTAFIHDGALSSCRLRYRRGARASVHRRERTRRATRVLVIAAPAAHDGRRGLRFAARRGDFATR
jgi:hypothetical protein